MYDSIFTGCDSTASKWVGWSTKPEANVEKPKTVDAPSLAEIMRTERQVVTKSPATPMERKTSPADVKINVAKKSSWRQLSFEEEKAAKLIAAASSPPKNPWKIPTAETPVSTNTMSNSSTNFKQVNMFAAHCYRIPRKTTLNEPIVSLNCSNIASLNTYYVVVANVSVR